MKTLLATRRKTANKANGNGRAATLLYADDARAWVPGWVVDLASFRRWLHSDDFPEAGRICFLNGKVCVDMSKEQLFSHNQVGFEYTLVVGGLAKAGKRGRYFPDGAYLSHPAAGLSCQPDGLFVLHHSFLTGQIRIVEGARDGYVELEGTPDMALEIVSDSSVEKDTDTLMKLYWKAGIAEYWLVDARSDRLVFDIYRHAAKGYVATRKQGGWVKSSVFGKSFRLTRETDAQGHPEFTLHVR